MKVAFDPAVLSELYRWKTAILQLTSPVQKVMLLLFLSILEPCSYTCKDGQFLQRKGGITVAVPPRAYIADINCQKRFA